MSQTTKSSDKTIRVVGENVMSSFLVYSNIDAIKSSQYFCSTDLKISNTNTLQ